MHVKFTFTRGTHLLHKLPQIITLDEKSTFIYCHIDDVTGTKPYAKPKLKQFCSITAGVMILLWTSSLSEIIHYSNRLVLQLLQSSPQHMVYEHVEPEANAIVPSC